MKINRIERVPGDRGKGEGRWERVVVRKDKKGKCGEEGNCGKDLKVLAVTVV